MKSVRRKWRWESTRVRARGLGSGEKRPNGPRSGSASLRGHDAWGNMWHRVSECKMLMRYYIYISHTRHVWGYDWSLGPRVMMLGYLGRCAFTVSFGQSNPNPIACAASTSSSLKSSDLRFDTFSFNSSFSFLLPSFYNSDSCYDKSFVCLQGGAFRNLRDFGFGHL